MVNTRIDVAGGAIACSPRGGHVRALHGSKLAWTSAHEQFTLKFEVLDGSGTRAWPFVDPEPSWPVFEFRGTLKPITGDERPAYKYTIVVGSKKLDPIIIVDKTP
jgi:hypothetical protein